MTRVSSKEIGRGISVNTMSPGRTKAEFFLEGEFQKLIDKRIAMNNFRRLAAPIDIAKVVEFLVSDNSRWISGQVIPVNGGTV
jgi:3-oxoacyl-[acyl-carrier protein] reductase